jgi:ABC-2 type transport system ATP-binding protein
MDPILEIEHLSKYFGEVKAVDDVSLTLNRGEIFGFLGPNGAGKTTTIGMILGLIYPNHGQIKVFGEKVSPNASVSLRNIGALIGATPAVYPYLSVYENIRIVADMHQQDKESRISEVIDMVGLSNVRNRKGKDLSTGMKQRLGLGMALIHQPELLILDEPTSGLDPNGTRFVRNLIRSLSEAGVTIFLSSHRLHEVEQICDRVAFLNRGKIIKAGSVAKLILTPDVLEVSVVDLSQAKTCLLGLPEIQLRVCDGNVLRVSGYEKEQIIKHMVEDGVIPNEVREVNQTLEDLFSMITEKEV